MLNSVILKKILFFCTKIHSVNGSYSTVRVSEITIIIIIIISYYYYHYCYCYYYYYYYHIIIVITIVSVQIEGGWGGGFESARAEFNFGELP